MANITWQILHTYYFEVFWVGLRNQYGLNKQSIMRLKPDMNLIISLPPSPLIPSLEFNDEAHSSSATSVTEEDIGFYPDATINEPDVVWETAPVNESLDSGHFFKTPTSPAFTHHKSNIEGLFSDRPDSLSPGHLSESDNSKPSKDPVRNSVLEERAGDESQPPRGKAPAALSGSTSKQRKSPSRKRAAKVRFADEDTILPAQEILPNIDEDQENGEGDSGGKTTASPGRATTGGKSIQPIQTPSGTKRKSASNSGPSRAKRSRKSPHTSSAGGH
jgi:hypothetical protein